MTYGAELYSLTDHWWIDWLIDRSFDGSIDQWIDWLISWLISWLIDTVPEIHAHVGWLLSVREQVVLLTTMCCGTTTTSAPMRSRCWRISCVTRTSAAPVASRSPHRHTTHISLLSEPDITLSRRNMTGKVCSALTLYTQCWLRMLTVLLTNCCQPVLWYVPFSALDLSLSQVFSSLVPPSPRDWLLGKWIGMFLVVFGVVNLVKCPD